MIAVLFEPQFFLYKSLDDFFVRKTWLLEVHMKKGRSQYQPIIKGILTTPPKATPTNNKV